MPRPPLSLRSRLSLLLLLLLREAPAPSHYIAYYLEESPRKISRYLSHLRRLGLVERDEYGIWYTTQKGRELVERYMESLNELTATVSRLSEHIRVTTKIQGNTRKYEEIQGNTSLFSQRTVLEKAEQLLGRRLTPLEEALINYLYDFAAKTGRKYWWPPEPAPLGHALLEELRRSSGSIDSSPGDVEAALRSLEARGVVYITYDRRRGVAKIRLSKQVLR